jgi:hypothetical protein
VTNFVAVSFSRVLFHETVAVDGDGGGGSRVFQH